MDWGPEPTQVELLCTSCMETTVHTLTYSNRHLVSIECEKCHRRTEMGEGFSDNVASHKITFYDIERLDTEEFMQRILTKPQRMTRELEQDLSLFLVTLPLRMITKPYRIMREVLRPDDHFEFPPKSDC